MFPFETVDRNHHEGRFTGMPIFQWYVSGWRTWDVSGFFEVNNVTERESLNCWITLRMIFRKLTLEQAKFKQSLGLNEWQPLPEGWNIRRAFDKLEEIRKQESYEYMNLCRGTYRNVCLFCSFSVHRYYLVMTD